jgi:hypothetical protein
MVCFSDSRLVQGANVVKSVVACAFPEAQVHDYPYEDEAWPAQLVLNVRDAAIVSKQFPDVYRPTDVIAFVRPGAGEHEALAARVLAAVAAASERGSSASGEAGAREVIETIECGAPSPVVFAVRCDKLDACSDRLLSIVTRQESDLRREPAFALAEMFSLIRAH